MILLNFSIEKSFTEIEYNGTTIDLHNDYLWTKTENNGDIVKLFFDRRKEEWINKKAPIWFCIRISGVHGFWSKESDNDYPTEHKNSDEKVPDLFGFSYSGDEIMEGPSDNIKSSEKLSALIFTAVTGKAIKIEGEATELIELKKL